MTFPASVVPDETLAATAQQGDRLAFDALVNRHKEMLYRLVRRYLGNADDAYDLLQETFIAAWENLHRYDPKRSFAAWTRTIALNKCRDFSRQRRFQLWISQLFAAEPTTETASPAQVADLAELETENQNRLQRLSEAIAALPPLYKEPLLLTTVGGLSQKAAAAILATSTKSVEMRLRRARHELSIVLNRSGEIQTPSKKKELCNDEVSIRNRRSCRASATRYPTRSRFISVERQSDVNVPVAVNQTFP